MHRFTAILLWFHNPRTLRWLRPVRRAVGAVVLVSLGWFVYSRLTTLPAVYYQDHASEPPRCLALMDECAAALRTYTSAPPEDGGPAKRVYDWHYSTHRALEGDWDRAANRYVILMTQHLGDPAIATALDRLVDGAAADIESIAAEGWPRERIVRRGWSDDGREDWPVVAPFTLSRPSGYPRPERAYTPALSLTIRARERCAAFGDLEGAWSDLRAALRLGHVARFHGYGSRRQLQHHDVDEFVTLPLTELAYMAREHALPPELSADMLRVLQDELGLSIGRALLEQVGLDRGPDVWLDEYFTDDGHGDGWFVLSYLRPEKWYMRPAKWYMLPGKWWRYGETASLRHPVWNLASPLFPSRRAAHAELEVLIDWISALDRMSYADQCPDPGRYPVRLPVTRLDVIVPVVPIGKRISGHYSLMLDAYERRLAALSVALSAYRTQHGEYPAALADLVPQLLSEVPLDPFTAAPPEYARVGDDFTLSISDPVCPLHAPASCAPDTHTGGTPFTRPPFEGDKSWYP